MNNDALYLARAIALARQGSESGAGGPFGAVIVRDGEILGEGYNRVVSSHDPTAHAEINAIRAACQATGHFHLPGSTLYTSSEPCPMCLAAAYWARIERIVYANPREAAAAIGFSDAQLYQQLSLPPAARSLKMEHLPIAGAEEPLKAWRESLGRVGY